MSAAATSAFGRLARRALALGPPAVLLVVAGCSTPLVGKVDPAMFPAAVTASAPPLTGRVALELSPEVRTRMHTGSSMCVARAQLPLGAIVEAALQRALGAAFTGGALPAALPLPGSSDATVALSLADMRLILDHKLNWFVPIPLPAYPFVIPAASSTTYSARLELHLRITDPLGRVLAQTTVDSGAVVVERGAWTVETPLERCLKLTHQAASQAATEAARVLRETLQADRQRERPL